MIVFIVFTGSGSHSICLENISSLDELTKFLNDNPNNWLETMPFVVGEKPVYIKVSSITRISIMHLET